MPLPGCAVRIVDADTGAEHPPGTPGEIVVRGYPLMLGYYRSRRRRRGPSPQDGWFHTGDMGVLRPDGHLQFLGRYKDMLKVGGENVDPMEVEGFLMGHPAIKGAAVVGVPDPRLSEVAVAFVQVAPGRCAERGGGHRALPRPPCELQDPRHVAFVDEFPMTSTGKIQKVVLRERARSEWPDATRDAPPAQRGDTA